MRRRREEGGITYGSLPVSTMAQSDVGLSQACHPLPGFGRETFHSEVQTRTEGVLREREREKREREEREGETHRGILP